MLMEHFYFYSQRTLEKTLFCYYHGVPETTYQDVTSSTQRGKLVAAHEVPPGSWISQTCEHFDNLPSKKLTVYLIY
jgi:hypothetical protein